jgi:hypothetical protein
MSLPPFGWKNGSASTPASAAEMEAFGLYIADYFENGSSPVVPTASAVYDLGRDSDLNMAIGSSFSSIQPGPQPSFAAYNVALGYEALNALTTGNYCTAVGTSTLKSNTSGVANTAVGTQALQSCTSGGNNTAVGQTALGTATTAAENTAVGWESMVSCTTGGFNTAVGQNSLVNLTTGTNNVAVGVSAGSTVVGGGNNTHVGYQAGNGSSSNFNNTTLIGKGTSATGAGAVAIGFDSSNNAATAAANVFALGTANHQVQVLNNTTGAGSALLGANSPAVTNTAPYTWFKMMSSDGSTVFVPGWK